MKFLRKRGGKIKWYKVERKEISQKVPKSSSSNY